MATQEDSRTLILVCRRAFGLVVERMLRREGFSQFRRGGLSLVGGSAVEAQEYAGEVLVLVTDAGSARRLVEVLRACPIREGATGLFALYTVGNGS
jgi:hypothetical protein